MYWLKYASPVTPNGKKKWEGNCTKYAKVYFIGSWEPLWKPYKINGSSSANRLW